MNEAVISESTLWTGHSQKHFHAVIRFRRFQILTRIEELTKQVMAI